MRGLFPRVESGFDFVAIVKDFGLLGFAESENPFMAILGALAADDAGKSLSGDILDKNGLVVQVVTVQRPKCCLLQLFGYDAEFALFAS